MNAQSLEARKLAIMEQLADNNDEAVILQIENLLKPNVDFWDELSEQEKATIKKGIQELDNGQRIDFKQFIQKYKTDSE